MESLGHHEKWQTRRDEHLCAPILVLSCPVLSQDSVSKVSSPCGLLNSEAGRYISPLFSKATQLRICHWIDEKWATIGNLPRNRDAAMEVVVQEVALELGYCRCGRRQQEKA